MISEQDSSAPSPQTTLVIILGASQWPFDSDEFTGSDAFAQAAKKLYTYFTECFGIPANNILWLFDSALDAIEIGKEISRHLKTFQGNARDVIVYYVGHAQRTRKYNQLYLAIRDTQEDNPERTSLKIENLASILEEQARALRRFYILDCCFAANALEDLQGANETDLLHNTFEEVEYKTQGYAALLSSGKLKPSALLPDHTNTFFSAALLHVLSETNQHASRDLSFEDVYEAIKPRLRVLYEQYLSYPEVEDPPEAVIYGEDLTRIPLFPTRHTEPEEREMVEEQATHSEIPAASLPLSVQAPPVQIPQASEIQVADLSGIVKLAPQQQQVQEEQLLHSSSGGLLPSSSAAKTGIVPLLRRRWFLTSALIALVFVVSFSSLYVWAYATKHGSIFGTQAGITPTRSVIPANFVAFSNSSFSLDYPRDWTHKQNNNTFSFARWDVVTEFIVSVNNSDKSSNAMVNALTGDNLSCTQQSAQRFSSVVVSNKVWQQSIWNCFLHGTIYVAHILTYEDNQTHNGTAIFYGGWQQVGSSKMINFEQANAQYFQPMLQSFQLK